MIEAPEQQYQPVYQTPTPQEPRPNWFLRHKVISALLIAGTGIWIGGRGSSSEPVAPVVATPEHVPARTAPITVVPEADPEPVPAPAPAPMRRWAIENMATVDAIMGDLADLGNAADRESVGGIVAACGSFKRHIVQLQASPAPDPAVNAELSQALRLYKQGADACINLDPDTALDYIVRAGSHMSAATNLLEAFSA